MIQHCRVCGTITGGMVTEEQRHLAGVQFGWPELDLCPMCVGKPEPEDEALLAILERANKETKAIRDAERAGEQISGETMEMRLK